VTDTYCSGPDCRPEGLCAGCYGRELMEKRGQAALIGQCWAERICRGALRAQPAWPTHDERTLRMARDKVAQSTRDPRFLASSPSRAARAPQRGGPGDQRATERDHSVRLLRTCAWYESSEVIDQVRIQNFKSLTNVVLELGRLTVLVGPNACGKTAVLQALQLLVQIAGIPPERLDPETVLGGSPRCLTYRQRWGEIVLTAHQAGDELSVVIHIPRGVPARMAVSAALLPPITTFLPAEGDGLAPVVGWARNAGPDELAQLATELGQIVRGVQRIRSLRDELVITFDDFELPLEDVGDGAINAIGLLVALRQRPRLLLLDDVGRGIHVEGQAELVRLLRSKLESDPELQIVCTTNSPYLLDLVDSTEVRVMALDAERRTHVRPLTEHPEFGTWKFGTYTGQLWATLGDDWVVPTS